MPTATTSSHCVHTFSKRVCISVGRILSFDPVIIPDPVLGMKYLTCRIRVVSRAGRILSFFSVISPDPVLGMKYLTCRIRVVSRVGRILSFFSVINPDPVLGMKYLALLAVINPDPVLGMKYLALLAVINPDPVLGMEYLACWIRVFSVPKQKPIQPSIRNSNTHKYPIGSVILWQKSYLNSISDN